MYTFLGKKVLYFGVKLFYSSIFLYFIVLKYLKPHCVRESTTILNSQTIILKFSFKFKFLILNFN